MSIFEPGSTVKKQFLVTDSSGQLTDADSTPTVTEVVDGIDQSTNITVSNLATGRYSAEWTISGSNGEHLQLRIRATVNGSDFYELIQLGQIGTPPEKLQARAQLATFQVVDNGNNNPGAFDTDLNLGADGLIERAQVYFEAGAAGANEYNTPRDVIDYIDADGRIVVDRNFDTTPADGDSGVVLRRMSSIVRG